MDFITGEKFYSVADFIYSSDIKDSLTSINDDYNKQINTFFEDMLYDVNIIYLHTMYKNQFFDRIKNLSNKFIIITHNSDVNIDSVDNLPDNVIKWYSQNVNIIDDRIESLPVGLENSRWFIEIDKKNKMILKIKEEKKYKNLLYINFNINNCRSEREEPYKIFQNKEWATVEYGRNGINFDSYLDNIYNHKFVLSPKGNGIDTHRLWECLYLGVIPVEKRNINNQFYTDLPICFVNNWNEIDEYFLNREYEIIKGKSWNLEKLSFNYWEKKIRNTI